jgi:hypothetical protein
MLADSANGWRKKKLLVTAAAMHHFLGKDDAALTELKTAKSLTFDNSAWEAERSKNYDQYLTSLIEEYIVANNTGKVPSDTETATE